MNKREDFTVNIAFVKNSVPIVGIVYAPAKSVVYRTKGKNAEKLTTSDGKAVRANRINCRARGDKLVAVASRSHSSLETEVFMKKIGVTDFTSVGSSLKFCILAEGFADVYPRFCRTMQWDTAAGDAVLRAAGGITIGLNGKPLCYGMFEQTTKSGLANANFVGWADALNIDSCY